MKKLIVNNKEYNLYFYDNYESIWKTRFAFLCNFKEAYEFLGLNEWTFSDYYPKTVDMEIINNGKIFTIESIKGTNEFNEYEDVIEGKFTNSYDIELLEKALGKTIQNGKIKIQLSEEQFTQAFLDQEWLWTQSTEIDIFNVYGYIETTKLDDEAILRIDSSSNSDHSFVKYDEDFCHYQLLGKIIKE